jgi:hypothetical protein
VPSIVPSSLPLAVDALVPLPGQFRHHSMLHGQAHVARVMVHAFRLLRATGHTAETARVWGAVYLHDLARTHDGCCERHGADAVRRFEREAALQQHLAEGGVRDDDQAALATAVRLHCRRDPPRDHPHWTTVALLKDADGLDRVRLWDLDPEYVRFPAARAMVSFAERLFHETDGQVPQGSGHFRAVLRIAERLQREG